MRTIALFLFAVTSTNTLAATTEQCGAVEKPVPYKYCITRSEGSTNKDILYYFHGGNGDEHQWGNNPWNLHVQKAWEEMGHQAPVVVTISFGPVWILVPRNTQPASGLLEVFRDQIMQEMESLAIGSQAARRLLMGHSMGGLNISALILNLPKNTFARTAMLCPAVLEFSPWAPADEIDAYTKKIGGQPGGFKGPITIAKTYVPDEETWKTKASTMALVATRAERMPPSLIAVNADDVYFRPGGRAFANEAVKAGAPVSSVTLPGNHCFTDAESGKQIADFLK